MGLDPNDLRLSIEAEVSAPGALEAAEQIRAAGQAADETRVRFDRLREQGGTPPAPPAPVLPAFNVTPPPALTPIAAPTSRPAPAGAQPAPTPAVVAPAAPPREVEQAVRQVVVSAPAPPIAAEQPIRQHVIEAPPPPPSIVQLVRQEAERVPGERPPTLQQSLAQVIEPPPEPVLPRSLEQEVRQVTRSAPPPVTPAPLEQPIEQVLRPAPAVTPEPVQQRVQQTVALADPIAPRLAPPAPEPEPRQPQISPRVDFANQLVRALVEQEGATAAAFKTAVDTVHASTRVQPTITPADLGITRPEPAAEAASAGQARVAQAPAPQLGATAVDAERIRIALEGAGLNGRSLAESARITSEAYRNTQIEQLSGQLRDAGLSPTQARREAQRVIPAASAGEHDTGQARVAQAPAPQLAATAIDAERIRVALEGAGLNSRSLSESARITSEAYRNARVETLSQHLREAGVSATQARHEAELAVPSPTPAESGGSRGLPLSTEIRGLGALVGIGFGLNVAVGAARLVHEAVVGIVDSQIEWERSLRQTTGLYGDLAPRMLEMARAQATLPGVVGNEQDFAQAAIQSRFLTTQYSVPEPQVQQLTTSAGRAAFAEGLKPEPARALQQQTLEAVESGGTQLRDRGIDLSDEAVARRLGLAPGAGVQGVTQSQLLQARTAIASEGLDTYSEQARQRGAGLLDARSAAQQALEEGRTRLQTNLEAGGRPSAVEPIGPELTGRFPGTAQENFPSTYADAGEASKLVELQRQFDEADAKVQEFQQSLGSAAEAQQQATRVLADLTVAVGTATNNLLRFAGSVEDPTSIARADVGAQAQAAVAQRAIGPDPLPYRPAAEIAAQATNQAGQAAYQSYVAPQAQAELERNNANRRYLEQQAGLQGPGLEDTRNRAQAALVEADRRQPAYQALSQGQQAQSLAGRAQTEAQASVTTLNLVDQQRQLAAAGDLATVRNEALNREGGIIDLQRQEADLADRMRVVNRENLDLLEQQTQARLAGLGATNQLNDLQFQQRRDTTEIRAVRADVRRGALDPSALQQIPELRQQVRAERLAEPRAELQALDATRPAELIGRAQTQAELNRTLQGIPLQEQQRGLEDQLTPLQLAQRLTEERTGALNRQLEIAQLAETSERTAAEQALIGAQQVGLAADAAVRSAEQWAANVNNGLTDLQRAQVLLSNIVAAPPPIGPQPAPNGEIASNPTPDRQQPPTPPPAPPADAAADNRGPARTPYDPGRVFDAWAGAPAPVAVAPAQIAAPSLPAWAPGAASLVSPLGIAGPGTAQPAVSSADNYSNTNYVTVTVPDSNASPHDIARVILDALNQRGTRAPRATPRTLVGAR